ncbi:unnamed protein product [Paramecium sonneborni]|uniref:Uncharacterized protein n=1 Tax=Paramecium sonneborni TaxID=65129 RepID=A0A8S1R2M8_9CILI|nr:unnamed protein product [Paramecium sonneborni]
MIQYSFLQFLRYAFNDKGQDIRYLYTCIYRNSLYINSLFKLLNKRKIKIHSQLILKRQNLKLIQMKEQRIEYTLRQIEIRQFPINLLTNSCKFTFQGIKIVLTIKVIENHFKKIQVNDASIGIVLVKQSTLKQILTSSIGKSLRIKKSPELRLNICYNSRRTSQFQTKKNKGTKIYFKIEYQMSFRDESVRNPIISEYTNKNNAYKYMIFHNESNQLDQDKYQLRQSFSENTKNQDYLSPSKNLKEKEIIQRIDFINLYQQLKHQRVCLKWSIILIIIQNCQSVHFILDTNPKQNVLLAKYVLNAFKFKLQMMFISIRLLQKYYVYIIKYKMIKDTMNIKQQKLFMDIEMQEINGFQTTKQILKTTQDSTKIVMCFAYDNKDNFQ